MIFNIKFSIIITSKFLLYFYICLDKQKQIIMAINKVTIVGIKGFKGSGKDTVASMISYILHDGIMKANYDTWLLYHKNGFVENDEIIIHFADKLKDDIAAFCNIDRKLLDRQDIKEENYYNFKTGIVSTNIIRMDMWFDPLTDILFRPCIRTPKQGAATAVSLLLDDRWKEVTGQMFASCKPKKVKDKFMNHPQARQLWADTKAYLEKLKLEEPIV